MTSYYLRKFIEDRQDLLHELLPDLHGEITLDRLLRRMCRQSHNSETQINIIESLVGIHKQMAKTALPDSMEFQNLDQRLLGSLGVAESMQKSSSSSRSMSVVQDCLEKLNALHSQALFFLGNSIGTKYLIETQPNDPWCQQFKITPRTGITYKGKLNENLGPQQIHYFQTWVDNYVTRCGNIFTVFMESGSDNDEALFDKI